MPALQREASLGRGKALGDLQQSVPQNGRVDLLSVDYFLALAPSNSGVKSSLPSNFGLHTFQDIEPVAFKRIFLKMFKVLFEILIFMVLGGLTPIDWTSKSLLQSFNFRFFCVILA